MVHTEKMFEKYFEGTKLEPLAWEYESDELYELYDHLEKYDRVIHLTSGIEDWEPHPLLKSAVHEEIDFSWGYDPEQYDPEYGGDPDDPEKEWLIPAMGHEWTWVPPEFRSPESWKSCKITVGGGARWECMEDFLNVLEHVGIPYDIDKELVYSA